MRFVDPRKAFAKIGQEPPAHIREYAAEIIRRTELAESEAERTSIVNQAVINEIVNMKLHLDNLYAAWMGNETRMTTTDRFGIQGQRVWRESGAGFEIGVWDVGDVNRGWFPVDRPPYPWYQKEFPQLCFCNPDGRAVLISAGIHEDSARWAHISVSRQNRIPSYGDLTDVKKLFAGKDRWAVQVFAPEVSHINIHPYVLHLWVPMDRYPLPNFARGGII